MTPAATEPRCGGCGDPVVAVAMPGGASIVPKLCRHCAGHRLAVAEEQGGAEERRAREARWEATCPPAYRATDLQRVPDRRAFEQVLGWDWDPVGLLAWGVTGTGKTRALTALCRRLAVAEGRRVVMFLGNSFAHECARVFGDHTSGEWLAAAYGADVVLLDDLGKFRLTERVESELFGLVEHRTSWHLPVLASVNASGAQLAAKLSQDRGWPLVRRLREFCREVEFVQPGGGR